MNCLRKRQVQNKKWIHFWKDEFSEKIKNNNNNEKYHIFIFIFRTSIFLKRIYMHGWTQPNLSHRRGSSIFGWSRVLLTPPCVGVGPRDCKPSLPWVRILNFKHNSPFEKTNVVFIFFGYTIWIFIAWYILNVVFSMSHEMHPHLVKSNFENYRDLVNS